MSSHFSNIVPILATPAILYHFQQLQPFLDFQPRQSQYHTLDVTEYLVHCNLVVSENVVDYNLVVRGNMVVLQFGCLWEFGSITIWMSVEIW